MATQSATWMREDIAMLLHRGGSLATARGNALDLTTPAWLTWNQEVFGSVSDLFDEPYYAATAAPPQLPISQAETRLRQVLAGSTFDDVSDTVKRWNATLRAEVRAVTALKFTDDTGRVAATAPVAVVDGMPKPLAEATDELETWQWWLVLHRPALEQADRGLKLVGDQREMLAQRLGDVSTRMGAVGISRSFISEILQHSVEKNILERFGKIEEDILGAYWIHASRIQIYWMPLAIFAPILGVSVATLTVAVLCHELVHAYTHRGIDIDGGSWRTDQFIKADTYVKEGLAQYYTEQVMHALGARLPDGLTTFLAKTEKQAAPYRAYQNWLGAKKQPSSEATRLAMLEFRNADPPVFDHAKFLEKLTFAQAQIGGRRTTSEG